LQNWFAQKSHRDIFRAGFCGDIKSAAHQLSQQNLSVCVQPQLRRFGERAQFSCGALNLFAPFYLCLNKQGITLIVSYVIKSETPLRLKDLIQSKKKKKQEKKEEGATEFSSESLDSPLRCEFFLLCFYFCLRLHFLYETHFLIRR